MNSSQFEEQQFRQTTMSALYGETLVKPGSNFVRRRFSQPLLVSKLSKLKTYLEVQSTYSHLIASIMVPYASYSFSIVYVKKAST